MVITAALGAAVLFGVASAFQHRSATQQSHEHALRVSLLLKLAAQPIWVAGVIADLAAYILQFVALSRGSLVFVQPLLVCGLLFALPLSAAIHHHRLGRLEWAGVVATVVGLSLFLVSADPESGRPQASAAAWTIVLAATLVPAAICLVLGWARPGPSIRRAVFLSIATGVAYGLTAALTKATASLLNQGIVHVLTGWQPYALIVVGAASLLTAQSAFQAGPLRASLPIISVLDPVVSILIGALAFGEGIANHGLRPGLEVLGLILLSGGILWLTRSPLVGNDEQPVEV